MKTAHTFRRFQQCHPLQRLDINGVAWEYIAAGQGPTCLLLLPGALGVADTSFLQILAFAESHAVISISYPPAISSVEPLLAGMAQLLDERGVTSVHLFGGSYSGPIAHLFAERYPVYVRSLIFSNTGLPQPWRLPLLTALRWIVQLMPLDWARWGMRRSIGAFMADDTPLAHFWRDYFRQLVATMSRAFLVNRLRIFQELVLLCELAIVHWHGRTLIVDASADRFFTEQERHALARCYPTAERVQLAVKGHGSALKDPTAQLAVCQAFLARIDW